MTRVYAATSKWGQSVSSPYVWPIADDHPAPEYWMVFRFSPPIAFSDACSTARASCAEALTDRPAATTNITNLFTIMPPEHLGSVPWAYNPRNPDQIRSCFCGGQTQ